MRLRLRLFLLALIAVLPAIAIQIVSEIEFRRARAIEVHGLALRQARLVASNMTEIINGSRQLLAALSLLPEIQALDGVRCNAALIRLLKELPAYVTITAADREGRLRCMNVPDPTRSIRERTDFRDVLLTGDFVIGEFAIGSVTGTKQLHVAHPIIRDQETIGVLSAGLDLQWLDQHLGRRVASADSVLMVADRNGVVLLHRPEGSGWVGRQLPASHGALVLGDQDRTAELTDLHGTDRVFAYVPVNHPPQGIAVAVGLDKRQAIAAIDDGTMRGIAQILGGLALGFAVAWLIGRHFVQRPVSALLDATQRWHNGELGARVQLDDRSSEIGQLAQAFDSMAGRLEEQLRQKDMLLREVNHRSMNSLQLLSSVLALQRRRIADPEAREQFEQARRRIQSMALVHRRLHRRDATDAIDVAQFLREFCAEIARAAAPAERAVDFRVECEPVWLTSDRVIPMALIVFELLTNAFKHAAAAGGGGQELRVACHSGADGAVALTVADNGPGLPPDEGQSRGLGMRLVEILAHQLRGTLSIDSGPAGTRFTLLVPGKAPAATAA